MKGPVNVSIGLVTGFAVGAIIGFAWAQGTKQSLSNHVATSVDSKAVTVRVDYMAALKDGLLTALNG